MNVTFYFLTTMICNMDTNSGLQKSVFPQEGHYHVFQLDGKPQYYHWEYRNQTLRTLSSSSFCLTDSGIPATSKHSLLEYWVFAQHCLSKSMTLCKSKELTFFVTGSCDSRI